MDRRRRPAGLTLLAVGLALLAVILGGGGARGAVPLGTATSFAVLANTTITNTGATTINGDVGLYPGTSVTGFNTVTLNGVLHVTDAVAQQALIDAGTAYRDLQSRTPCTDLTGKVLGQDVGTAANPLLPGVYCFSSSAQLTGDLYLSGGGEYVFRIGSTLTTASGSHVILQSGAEACNVYWAVGSSATLGTNSQIAGTIIANVSITANTGAVVNGRLFALTGAVTLDANTIGGMNCPPAPTTTTTLAPTTTSTVAPTTTSTTIAPTTTSTVAPTTTTAPPATTTSTSPTATTTTTQPGATTTTQAPGATTTTLAPGATTTTLAPATTTTTPASGTTTTTPASGTTTTVGTGSTPPAADQTTPGATTPVGPGATTATTGVPLFAVQSGLPAESLARTGQGISGPLSLAVVSIFLGALLLLAPRRAGLPAMAVAQPGTLGSPLRPTAQISAPTAQIEADRRGGRLAPNPSPPTPNVTPPAEPVAQVRTPRPGLAERMESLDRQLHEADARLKAIYASGWVSGTPDSEK
ncbi:MAG TPA: ice-binding family protein [Acidimicrobiales bacterium]|nr:ice-binding family protein [Acidimicrobiales bacterium]